MVTGTVVAERELLCSLKGGSERRRCRVQVFLPELTEPSQISPRLDGGAASCRVAFDGVAIPPIEVHGIDSVHALGLAIDIDRHLRSFAAKYDFYWATGEPYFEAGDAGDEG
jgi:hypothetical protein